MVWHTEGNRDVLQPHVAEIIKEGIVLDRHYVFVCALRLSLRTRLRLTAGWRRRLLAHSLILHVGAAPLSRQPGQHRRQLPGVRHRSQHDLYGPALLRAARCCRVSLLSRAGIPKKLKQAGYQTHAFGKWHLGMASPDHTPLGRGFDNSLIFFAGAQDHWSNCNCVDPTCAAPNNGFISGHNRSAGAHCWRTIADPLTQVPTVAFA